MIIASYNKTVDAIFKGLSGVYNAEIVNKGKGVKNINISMKPDLKEISFNNNGTMKNIVLEKVSDNNFIIHVFDYYNQKSLLRYVVSDADTLKQWNELYNKFEQLIASNKEIQKVAEVEDVVFKFFV